MKRPKQEDCERLQEATIQLLEQQQNLCSLLREVGVSEETRRKAEPPQQTVNYHNNDTTNPWTEKEACNNLTLS